MPRYGSDLQKNAYDLFENQEVDMKQWANCSFKIELDDKNMKYIAGKEEVKEMKEIKKTLEDMIKEWEEYDEYYDEEETCMIFDLGGYAIGETRNEARHFIYEYEIDEYYDLIVGKIEEYNIRVKKIEDEQAKKDVCVGVTLALLMRQIK